MNIVTDCAADLPVEELKELGITQVPLYIQFPDGEVNSADITADEFYDRLEAMRPEIPTTAMPSAGYFASLYAKLAEAGEKIMSIHVSSGLSGTINAARMGAEQVLQFAQTHIWDSMTLSGGERFQVLAATLAARAGWEMEKIQARLAEIRAHTEVIFTLETMDYLARGGRIGRVQALAGSLLKIKPVIHVAHEDGKYSTVAKSRTVSACLELIANHLAGLYKDEPLWVTVMHGRFADAANSLAVLLQERLNIQKLETLRISPVLGVHTGPGIVGATVVPFRMLQDLAG